MTRNGNDTNKMETMCLAAGGLAAVAIVLNYDKIPVLREYPIVSACKAMRSTVVRRFNPGGDKASARLTTQGPFDAASSTTGGSATDPMASNDEEANTEQLAELAKQAASASTPAAVNNRPPPPMVESSMMSNLTREIGQFQTRIGDSAWEYDLSRAPAETECEAITLPLSQYQAAARTERQMSDGIRATVAPAGSSGTALDDF